MFSTIFRHRYCYRWLNGKGLRNKLWNWGLDNTKSKDTKSGECVNGTGDKDLLNEFIYNTIN